MTLSNWQPVARKDFEDAVRSKLMIGLMAVFVLFILGGAFLFIRFGGTGNIDSAKGVSVFLIFRFLNGLFILLPSPVTTILPIACIAATYRALAGERETGSIKLLLSLPHSRADALVGKFVGRSAVVMVPILFAVILSAVYTVIRLGLLDPVSFLLFVVVTLAYACVWVAIGVTVSASTGSSARAALGGIVVLVVFKYAWGFINNFLVYVVNGGQGSLVSGQAPPWSQFLRRLSPEAAYTDATITLLRATVPGPILQQLRISPTVNPQLPAYLRPEWGFLLLALWIVVPLALAYVTFEGSDL